MHCPLNYADDQKYSAMYTAEKSNQNSEKCMCTRQSIFHGSVNFKRVSCQKSHVYKVHFCGPSSLSSNDYGDFVPT